MYSTFEACQSSREGILRIRGWIRRLDLFERGLVLIPIHKSVHWFLITVHNLNTDTIRLCLHDPKYGRRFSRVLDEVEDLLKQSDDDGEHQMCHKRVVKEFPCTMTQNNDCDCGVYLCQIAKAIAFGHELMLNDKDMVQVRGLMKKELHWKKVKTTQFAPSNPQGTSTSQRLSTKKPKHQKISFRNPGDKCWLNSSLQLLLRAMDIKDDVSIQSDLGKVLQTFRETRYKLLID